MTTATRKKIPPKPPLLQQGDRIRGTSAKGTQYTGSFEGYTTDEWIRCNPGYGLHTGEKTIALNPVSVERVAPEPEPELDDICEEEEAVARACGALTDWQPQEGDRVAGSTIEGNPDQGIITQVGAKYVILDNQLRRALTIATLTLLQPQAVPADLLHLVGLSWSEQVDAIFGDRGIANLANYSGTKPDLTHFESWCGWIVYFSGGTEVHLCKAGQQDSSWFFALAKHPTLKGNGDISRFCHRAIDEVEEAIAAIAASQGDEAAAPMQSLSALLPPVAASIATHAQTAASNSTTRLEALAAEIEAIYAEAEEAETTMLNAGRAAFTRSLALGEKLLAAKAEAAIGGYGKWLPWLEARGIPERKAQRAIRLFSHRQLLTNSVTASELTLTEALAIVSKKALKPEVLEPPRNENAPIAAKLAAPETEAPDRALFDVAPKTEALEDENRASVVDAYEYIEMTPVDVWFDPGDGVIAGTAIAANGKGMVRINWGRGKQSDVPRDRVQWSPPELAEFELEPVFDTPNSERPVQPNGIVEDRPACSRWEPEEVANMARIQLQGLLKHLSPSELVKAAIVQSKVSLVDATLAILALANEDEIEAISDLFDKEIV